MSYCNQCGGPTKNPKFCSRSCAASYNNRKAPKRKPQGVCQSCSEGCGSGRTYCEKCVSLGTYEHRLALKIDKWKRGEWLGGSTRKVSGYVRTYLLREAGYSCESCGFNQRHPDDGASILEIDHINGNGTDHRPENLRVLCPNCHALTSTYRGRNSGHGRPYRYVRVL